jgi:hypothetical protein
LTITRLRLPPSLAGDKGLPTGLLQNASARNQEIGTMLGVGPHIDVCTWQKKLAPFPLPYTNAATESSLQAGLTIALDENLDAIEIAERRVE